MVGTTIALTATVTGGTSPQQCKWLVTTDPSWATYNVLRTWTACTSPAPWTPTVAGTYQLGLWARSSGNTTDAPEGGAAAAFSYTITAPAPPTITSLGANLSSPQVVGTTLSLSATVTGGTAPQQCKWLVTTDPTWATYSVLRTWTACTSPAPWTPTVAGTYQLGLWARSNGNTTDAPEGGAAAAVSYTITAPAPPTITGLGANLTSPQVVGTTISLSATVTGGTAPQQCKWLVTTDPTWATYTTLRTWTACTSPAPWTPTVAGTYQLGLWARSSGNTTDAPEGGAAAAFSYTITPIPMTVTITATPISPQRVNTALSFGATVTGGTAPQSCKWLVSTDGWATYTTLRDWAVCTTPASWTPTAPWSYQVGVWVRSSGSSTDYPETAAAMIYDVVPDVRGTYTGSGSATQSGCTDPIDNGVFPFRGSFNIPTQTRQTFSGTGTFDTGEDVVTATLSGTVTGTGQLSGALTIAGGMGGTVGLTGTQSGTTLSVAFNGQVREGSNTCNVSGSFTGTR
jgi:hypothetical protein